MALKAGRKGVFPFFRKQEGQTTQAGVDEQGRVWYKEGETYTLPVASSTTLGGVKPVAKTSAMTANVGVDVNGALFSEGGNNAISVFGGDFSTRDIVLNFKSTRTNENDVVYGDVILIFDCYNPNASLRMLYVRSGGFTGTVVTIGGSTDTNVVINTNEAKNVLTIQRRVDTYLTVVVLKK